jgi:hypothetical protein
MAELTMSSVLAAAALRMEGISRGHEDTPTENGNQIVF